MVVGLALLLKVKNAYYPLFPESADGDMDLNIGRSLDPGSY